MKEAKKYLLDIGFDDAHLPLLFNDDDKSYYTIIELMHAYTDHKLKLLGIDDVVKSLPSKEEILLQARKVENYIGDEMPIVGAEKSGKFHGFLEGVEWLSNIQK